MERRKRKKTPTKVASARGVAGEDGPLVEAQGRGVHAFVQEEEVVGEQGCREGARPKKRRDKDARPPPRQVCGDEAGARSGAPEQRAEVREEAQVAAGGAGATRVADRQGADGLPGEERDVPARSLGNGGDPDETMPAAAKTMATTLGGARSGFPRQAPVSGPGTEGLSFVRPLEVNRPPMAGP